MNNAQGAPVLPTVEPKDPIDRWIASVVAGRSFVDIGGIGERSGNERATFAAQSGASRVTMADLLPSAHAFWPIFREKCRVRGVAGVCEVPSTDIADPGLAERLGVHDVVHCTGVFYHLANPVLAFDNLRKVVGEHLIVNTVTVPERIENEYGRLDFSGSTALFLPGITEHERDVLRAHYTRKFGWNIDDVVPRLNAPDAAVPCPADEKPVWRPYWWFFTDESFRALVQMMGFEIRDQWKWADHCLALLARKRQQAAMPDHVSRVLAGADRQTTRERP